MTKTHELVQRLWGLCNILRDDGITYHQYVNELSYLLFLKMADETGTESQLPHGFRWRDLASKSSAEQFNHYRHLLVELGTRGNKAVRQIFANPTSLLRQPRSLSALVVGINALDWYSAKREGLGELYEGLLQKNANEQKSGAGQYFTPRPLIEAIVECSRPAPGEVIQDPAAGTCGFLIVSEQYIRAHSKRSSRHAEYVAVELNQDVHRLALMNVLLHDLPAEIEHGDALSDLGTRLQKADLVLTNPPFGTKRGGGGPTRSDLPFPTLNKQLAFLQHVVLTLKPGGRAAVIVPDNVLAETGVGLDVRRMMLDQCDLHTILRLPAGIFYAAGVKTNVLFFRKCAPKGPKPTRNVWVYDLRTAAPAFGKRRELHLSFFADFIESYGTNRDGDGRRDTGTANARFRSYPREHLRKRGDNLDLSWLEARGAGTVDELPDPDIILASIAAKLDTAADEIQAMMEFTADPDTKEHRDG